MQYFQEVQIPNILKQLGVNISDNIFHGLVRCEYA